MKQPNETGTLQLAEVFAKIVCSNHNQNIIMLIEGKPGQGKSWAALRIATYTSMYIAKYNGGNPWDYFTLDNVGIIMPDDMLRVIQNMGKRNVVIFDDMGMAYSGRQWQSEGNQAMNAMMQTIRTDNNIIIITVPDAEWIDKIGRNILRFKIVMNEPLHDIGYSLGKASAVEKLYNSQGRKNINPYLKSVVDSMRVRYNHVAFNKPPEAVTDEYEKRRSVQLERLKQKSIEEYQSFMKKGDVSDEPPKVTKKERIMELKRDVEAGIYPTLKSACKQAGMSYDYARQVVTQEG